MSKNIIIKGTLILTIAGLITKLLGFYNRIFLTRVIGVQELGVYQLIFPIFMLSISISCQGVATALTKHISYYLSKKNYLRAKNVFKLGLIISLSLSLLCAIIVFTMSDNISRVLLKNTDCSLLLRIIAASLPFVAIKSCINAHFLGDSNPKLQGFLHMFEQLIRVIIAYILAYLIPVTGKNASLATLAVASSEVLSCILCIVIFKKTSYTTQASKSIPTEIITKSFLQDMLPITANNLIFTLFSSLEAIILPAMLFRYYSSREIAMELYGIVTGIVIPFLLFPATITTSLSTMLLPAISGAKASRDKDKINKAIRYCIAFCSLLGLISFLGYYVLGKWACRFAFDSLEAGILLRKMSFLCPLIYLSNLFSTILNGLDKAFNNTIINVLGLIVRISVTLILVPLYGLKAYISGIFISYLIIIILTHRIIRSYKITKSSKE